MCAADREKKDTKEKRLAGCFFAPLFPATAFHTLPFGLDGIGKIKRTASDMYVRKHVWKQMHC